MRKKMNNKLFCLALVLALTFSVAGCGKPNPGTDGNGSDTAGVENIGPAGSDPSGEDLFLSLEDLPWRDNSLDAYSAVLNVPLRRTEPEDAVGGISAYFLGNARASIFSNYFFSDDMGRFYGLEEITSVTDQGEEAVLRLDFREKGLYNVRAGGVAGSDHHALMGTEEEEGTGFLYHFFEADEDMEVLHDFYVDGIGKDGYEFINELQVDAQGNLHMVTYGDSAETYHYYVAAPDGSFLTEVSPREGYQKEQTPKLFFLCDGRVGMLLDGQLQCADAKTGSMEMISKVQPNCLYCTLWDERTLLYADGTGLYRSDLSGKNPEPLYAWSNHGVSVTEILAMQVTEGGNVGLIYKDYKEVNYLKLAPTAEEVEILEITFAVPSSRGQKYQAMVAAFNKKHPAYHVRMKSYGLNDTRLLTELIAGEGPVLVDTSLVNFGDNAEWWEPLDEAFRQMQLDGELIPQAMEVGKIDGTLCGVVTDFSLNTVVTFAEEPGEWDYDAFLNCFDEKDPDLKSVFGASTGSDGYSFISSFFYHGLKGKYLFDAENRTTNFDSGEFRKILRLGRTFMERNRQGTAEDLRQGTSICAVVSIQRPEDLAFLRIWGEGKLRFIGYPSGEGARHYVEGSDPISVRVGATAEEKRLARSFLQFLLSHDAQMEAVLDSSNHNYHMSVRRDVLEEQINRVHEHSYPYVNGFPQLFLGDQVDHELDRAALYGLLEQAEPSQRMPLELVRIFSGELNDYLSGNMTEDALIEHLENRVGLYLSEQK